MEFRQLSHFVAVAEDGSFTRAARRLSYVQSAVSVSVQALERELGVRLFDRTTHRVVLTDAGQALLPAARRALAAAEEIRDIAAAVTGVVRGTLRVGIMQAVPFTDVPALLGAFHRQHPDVEIQVRPAAGGSAALVEELRQGGLDIVFAARRHLPAELTAIPLGSEELMLVTAAETALPETALPETALPETALPETALPETALPETALPGHGAVPLARLADARFVDFPAGWGVRSAVDEAFAGAGLERNVTLEVADVETCLQLLRAGLGVALLPPSLIPAGDRQLRRRAVTPAPRWHVVMARPAGHAASAAATAFADLVIRAMASS